MYASLGGQFMRMHPVIIMAGAQILRRFVDQIGRGAAKALIMLFSALLGVTGMFLALVLQVETRCGKQMHRDIEFQSYCWRQEGLLILQRKELPVSGSAYHGSGEVLLGVYCHLSKLRSSGLNGPLVFRSCFLCLLSTSL